ncbi:aspartokinase/homoserine dehydrogenase, chloroplastic [Seminavis robusta]|uniref:Aspartokinase/homoserine dehydrogenase, chloroplastic n=1 Tax=Seminavis robusta TaxID=568900 RepID=A0A9N8EWP1_9STRA|nr:aspartokinase/homoserine dehydrogenase, chloroplastic [Seminavis robusta]|eukprot:Sro1825_g300070.1 aspartokinase/homoserine dehydrogenase, chloroplastic (954) ;mRNA; f:17207-20068
MKTDRHQSSIWAALLLAGSILSSASAFTATKTPTSLKTASLRPSLISSSRLFVATEQEVDGSASSSTSTSTLYSPPGTSNAWEIHKFGGASLATAELYKTVGDLLCQEAQGRGEGVIPTMAVVSAKGGMTDLLVQVVDGALLDMNRAEVALSEAVTSQIAVLQELVPNRHDITEPIIENFRQDEKDILSVVQSLRMIQTVPAVTMEVVTGYGEIWSAQTLHAYVQSLDTVPTAWIDARDVLVVKGDSNMGLGEKGAASTGGVVPLWEETTQKLEQWWQEKQPKPLPDSSPIVIVTGFVAKTAENVPTTLKRSGSDYSATIFAKLTDAARVTMWKNTNGVYTADPRRVPEAFPISSLKYDEAMELAYFGAQVLHPSAMEPCIDKEIPVYVRNIFNPAFEGTVIRGRCPTLKESNEKKNAIMNWRASSGEIPIKGITSVDKVALVTLEGATMAGASVAARFLGAMASADVTVLIITQASSESSITVAVPESQGELALAALKDAFELELARENINSLSLTPDMSIVAIVGEGMALKSGVSSTFMTSLARANVNIRLIAQGSSERQIAVVVEKDDATRALRAAHMAFTLSETTASVAILGSTGLVGTALASQIQGQREMLNQELGIDLCVTCASCSTKMVSAKDSRGLDLSEVSDLLKSDEEGQEFDFDEVTKIMEADVNPLRIIVDCTNTEKAGEYYERWLSKGIHIVSPGRKVGSGDLDLYNKICAAQKGHAVEWYTESSVGSALPVISTIRDLFETGDRLNKVTGCLSGTMAFVFSTFDESLSFSEALSMAAEKGYTENDLCEDLSGQDMARKVVILARQIGLDVSLDDVELESLLPDTFSCAMDTDALLEDCKSLDKPMLDRFKAAQEKGCKLRYKFEIDCGTGKCKCQLLEIPNTEALFRLKRNENLVAFDTKRYETSPLIVKGAAAGPELAASGIFADLLRLTRAYSANQI